MYSVHERIARDTRVALECLERAFPTLKPLPINLRQASFPPLQLGAHNIDVELRQLKCSENTSRTLSDLFARAVQQLTRSACDDFRATLQEIEASAVDGLATEKCWEVSLRKKYTQAFEEDVGRLRESLLDLVRSSFAKVEAAKRERDRDSSGQFTDEVVDILVQAFEETPSVSKADRLILTEATGLNDRQILTWVRCVYRARSSDSDHVLQTVRKPTTTKIEEVSSRCCPLLSRVSSDFLLFLLSHDGSATRLLLLVNPILR